MWAVDIFSQYVISLVMKHKKSYVKKQRREPLIANADEIIWNQLGKTGRSESAFIS